MTEAAFQSAVMKRLRVRFKGLPAFFWKVTDKFRGGIPDIVGCYKGIMWAIELKVGKNKTSALQDVAIGSLQKAGAMVAVCWTMEEVMEFIETVIKRGDENV